MAKTRIGYAKAVITPPLGTQLAGHAVLERPAKAVHDDLFARVLVLEFAGIDYCLIQNDLLGLDYEFIATVKDELAELGIKKENVFLGCTHTHSGPKGLVKNRINNQEYIVTTEGYYDEPLCLNIQKAIKTAVKEALANKDDCVMRYGTTVVSGVCSNRNHRDKVGDPLLLALEFIRDDGKRLLLYNFSCHPTIVNHGNYEITADFPGAVAKLAEACDYEMAVFTNGSSGDISTRFTRREASFDEVARIGGILWSYIQEALADKAKEDISEVVVKDALYKLQLKEIDSIEAATAKLAKYEEELALAQEKGLTNIRSYESFVEGAVFNLFRAQYGSGVETDELRYKLLKINDLIFVFVPVEMFSDLTNALKQEYQGKLFFCTVFNGYINYLADAASYEMDTYETQSSGIAKGQGEAYIAALKEELKML